MLPTPSSFNSSTCIEKKQKNHTRTKTTDPIYSTNTQLQHGPYSPSPSPFFPSPLNSTTLTPSSMSSSTLHYRLLSLPITPVHPMTPVHTHSSSFSSSWSSTPLPSLCTPSSSIATPLVSNTTPVSMVDLHQTPRPKSSYPHASPLSSKFLNLTPRPTNSSLITSASILSPFPSYSTPFSRIKNYTSDDEIEKEEEEEEEEEEEKRKINKLHLITKMKHEKESNEIVMENAFPFPPLSSFSTTLSHSSSSLFLSSSFSSSSPSSSSLGSWLSSNATSLTSLPKKPRSSRLSNSSLDSTQRLRKSLHSKSNLRTSLSFSSFSSSSCSTPTLAATTTSATYFASSISSTSTSSNSLHLSSRPLAMYHSPTDDLLSPCTEKLARKSVRRFQNRFPVTNLAPIFAKTQSKKRISQPSKLAMVMSSAASSFSPHSSSSSFSSSTTSTSFPPSPTFSFPPPFLPRSTSFS